MSADSRTTSVVEFHSSRHSVGRHELNHRPYRHGASEVPYAFHRVVRASACGRRAHASQSIQDAGSTCRSRESRRAAQMRRGTAREHWTTDRSQLPAGQAQVSSGGACSSGSDQG